MVDEQQRVLVKRGAKRTLWLEVVTEASRGAGEPQASQRRAIKRFEVADAGRIEGERGVGFGLAQQLFRARARRRAVRERDALLRLAALGFPVPEPLAITVDDKGVELSLRWIDGAVSLADIVRGRAPWPADRRRIARELGRLLALARRHGVTHGDLHSGNVLVDLRGAVWLVDVARVTVRDRPLSERLHARNCVTMLADLREHTTLAWRLALAIASAHAAGRSTPTRAELAAWDRAARRRRLAVVLRSSARWLRTSSVAELIIRGDERGVRARAVDEATAWQTQDDERAPAVSGTEARVLESWRTAARLVEHGIPSPEPLVLRTHPNPRAVFADCGFSRSTSEIMRDPRSRSIAARSLGALLGRLTDRGLALTSRLESSVAFDAAGQACVLPTAVVAKGTRAETRTTAMAHALGRSCSARERAAFVIAFLSELEVAPPELRTWRERWLRGAQPRREPLRRRTRAAVLSGATRVAGALPTAVVRATLAGLSPLARLTRYERTTRANLELALGGERTTQELDAIARGVRLHSARIFAEWLRLARAAPPQGGVSSSASWIDDLVELDPSVAILERELQHRRGAIVVSAHIGNWELLAARLRRAGHAGAVVGYRRPNDSTAAWFERMRSHYGVQNIPQSAHPRTILRALEEGSVVGLLADLEVRRLTGVFVPFFGRPALTLTAPAALSRAARRPLLPARCVFDARRRRYRLIFDRPLDLDPTLAPRERTLDLCARLNRTFEDWIRADPEQWAWHQPRWRTQPLEVDISQPRALDLMGPHHFPQSPPLGASKSLHSADEGLSSC
ncbi:MAG: hypothetical protein JNL28_11255 [Planctomycetes bacterium]|nr:hypothetical protein [Planctomycetota bacterium]